MIIVSFAACDHSVNANEKYIVLKNGRLLDGTMNPPLENAVIIVEEDRIKSVGTGDDVVIPDESKVIDLKGATILPGFINAHVHRGYNEQNLKNWAKNGVTTVRDLGAVYNQALFENRNNLNKVEANARLVSSGPMVTADNGYPDAIFNSPTAYFIHSVDDVDPKITELINAGCDLIKIAIESGACFNQTIPMLSDEMIREIVNLSHQHQKKVSAHILVAADLEKAVQENVDDIAHMSSDWVSDALINEMVIKNIYWVPTLELWKCANSELANKAISNLRRFVSAGGNVALGTDFQGYNCEFDRGMPMTEIMAMYEAGMSARQIICAATMNAAVVCDLDKELGSLEPGKIADIIVVNGDPLENLNVLDQAELVIHNGKIIFSD